MRRPGPHTAGASVTFSTCAARDFAAPAIRVEIMVRRTAPVERRTTMATTKQKQTRYAFPEEGKEPLNDARHVRNAIARFNQVEGVSDAERDRAWKRIMAAAKKYDIEVEADDWRELSKGGKPR
jgi:Family of unknown function (DUF6582)